MKRIAAVVASLIANVALLIAQQGAPSAAPAQTQVSSAERAQIDDLFTRYVAAYKSMSMHELRLVWPGLPDQEREYQRIKDQFDSGDVRNIEVSIQIQEINVFQNFVVVRGARHEQYLKAWHSNNTTTGITGVDTVPLHNANKVTLDQDVEVTLRRSGDGWVIASITGKSKPKKHVAPY